MRSSDSHSRRGRGGRKLQERRADACEVMMRALGAPAEGVGMLHVLAAQHAQLSSTPFAHLSSIEPTCVSPFLLRPPYALHCTGLFDKVARTTPTRARRSSPITPRARRARGIGWRCFGRLAVHARRGAHLAAAAAAGRQRAGDAGGGRADAERRRQRVGGRSGSRRMREQPEAAWRRHFLE